MNGPMALTGGLTFVGDRVLQILEQLGAFGLLAAQTARGYFAVIEARTQAELARQTLDNQRLAYVQIRERYARGLRPSLDLRLGRSSTATGAAAPSSRCTSPNSCSATPPA